jgi:lipopolysaccharide export system protein LptC
VLTPRNSTIGALLLLAAGLSGWSMFMPKKSVPIIVNSQQEKPDAFMENVVATIFNKEGKPALKIETAKMTHFAEDDTTQMTTPHVTVYRQSPNPWYIDSDYAKSSQGIAQIIFWSNVVIHHPEDVVNPTTTMQTASLTVFPDKQIAQTNEAVTLTQPDTTIHAVGMLANLGSGTVKLISQARTEYVPKL